MWSNRTASSDGYRRRSVGVVKAGGVLGSNNRVVIIGSHKDRGRPEMKWMAAICRSLFRARGSRRCQPTRNLLLSTETYPPGTPLQSAKPLNFADAVIVGSSPPGVAAHPYAGGVSRY